MNNIKLLMNNLPKGYEEACFTEGAMKFIKEIKTPGDLMLLVLMYVLQGLSHLEVSVYAKLSGIANISDVAFAKKLAKCNGWFEWILERLERKGAMSYQKPPKLDGYDIIAVDASDVVTGGKQRKIFRLHFALDIFKMRTAQLKLTAEKIGESLKNFVVKKNQLYLVDRAYGTITSLEHCRAGGAKIIARLRTNAFKLYNQSGKEIDLLKKLKAATETNSIDLECFYRNENKELIKVRVCAKRKTPDAMAKSDKKVYRKTPKGKKPTPQTLTMNQYIVLVTSLDSSISSDEILELYRYRWQVELYFKRLKSLMGFGNLPNKTDKNILSWLNAKLIAAILTECLLAEASFSPGE